jgi:hypothetical protein
MKSSRAESQQAVVLEFRVRDSKEVSEARVVCIVWYETTIQIIQTDKQIPDMHIHIYTCIHAYMLVHAS